MKIIVVIFDIAATRYNLFSNILVQIHDFNCVCFLFYLAKTAPNLVMLSYSRMQ